MKPESIQAGLSPVQTLPHSLFDAAGITVQVLRLDMLHPVISGNKWMKLQPWLKLVEQRNLKGIVTKGGPFSNHIHAAAYTAFINGLSCTVVVRGKEGIITPTLTDVANWNATIMYAPADYDNDEKWEMTAAVGQQLFIPMGGEGPVAAQGVKDFIAGLNLPRYEHVICPVGTGTTMHGIAMSRLHRKSLTGINPGIRDDYSRLLRELSQYGSGITIRRFSELKKFGQWPEFLPGQMNEWYENWQLPTDLVYTSKMIFAFFEILKENIFQKGDSCLLIHTGGLQGNRSLPGGVLHF